MKKEYKMELLFKVSKTNKSSYYKWRNQESKAKEKETEEKRIIKAVEEIQEENKYRYGVLPMTAALEKVKGIKCNHKKVYRLMKENNLLSEIKRKKEYKKAGKAHPKRNVLKRNFETSCPYDKIATDVTEIAMFGKKIYISPIKDLHTRMIESVEISNSATGVTAKKMFEKIKDKAIAEGTIFHSDQGSIYTSKKYQKMLEENNFIQSMSRKGTPIDNAPMESFFSTLKSEVIYNPKVKITNIKELKKEIEEYFVYYNEKRIQKGLGYLTPKEYKEKEIAKICG